MTTRHDRNAAHALALMIADTINDGGNDCAITGSIRRWKQTVGDIDMVVLTRNLDGVTLPDWLTFERGGESYRRYSAPIGYDTTIGVDIWRCADENHWGGYMLFSTGSAEYNIYLRLIAKQQGMTLNQSGLWRGKRQVALGEQQIVTALGVDYLTPRERETWTTNKNLTALYNNNKGDQQ